MIRVRNVSHFYGTFKALETLSFEIPAGTIHALVGENGAGKSTLAKIMAGAIEPSEGSVEFDIKNPSIGMIHQHFALVDNLTVLENWMLFT
ncbi:MAG: ATP-binding cassette domain-containing protein, partial [Bdellovibrionota bacterium]